jgi:hypothetical protein
MTSLVSHTLLREGGARMGLLFLFSDFSWKAWGKHGAPRGRDGSGVGKRLEMTRDEFSFYESLHRWSENLLEILTSPRTQSDTVGLNLRVRFPHPPCPPGHGVVWI